MSMADLVGRTIGQYHIEAALDAGGMGQVFHGVHLFLDRPAAIKIMREHLASNADFRTRFLREATSSASLKHDNIVSIYDFGEQDGLLYLVMELMLSGSLRTFLQRQAHLPETPLFPGIDLVRQAAEGLAAAHAQGIIHRDIKPDNLLLNRLVKPAGSVESYQLKISDFGLARLAEKDEKTSTGGLVGTLAYMSPEQCQGKKLDGRSDLYSLGIVLYEVATGQRPFQIDSIHDAMQKHIYEPPPSPRKVRSDLSTELDAIILRCLAKQPEERYNTVSELASALQELQAATPEMLDTLPSPFPQDPSVTIGCIATFVEDDIPTPVITMQAGSHCITTPVDQEELDKLEKESDDVALLLKKKNVAMLIGRPRLPRRLFATATVMLILVGLIISLTHNLSVTLGRLPLTPETRTKIVFAPTPLHTPEFHPTPTADSGHAKQISPTPNTATSPGAGLDSVNPPFTLPPTKSVPIVQPVPTTRTPPTQAPPTPTIAPRFSNLFYPLSGGTLSQVPGDALVASTIASAQNGNYDAYGLNNPSLVNKANMVVYKAEGITAAYNAGQQTQFHLFVDAGTSIADGVEVQVLYDFNHTGNWDRVETYPYFATDNVPGWELYASSPPHVSGPLLSTGQFENMHNGTLEIRLWNAIGNSDTYVSTSSNDSTNYQSVITIPFH